MGINEATLCRWKNQFPQIIQALKKGKTPVDFEVENALLKRAMGFEYEEVVTEILRQPDGTQREHIKKIRKTIPPDTTAAIFWLKNRKPEQWRDKREQIVSTKDGMLADLISGLKEPVEEE